MRARASSDVLGIGNAIVDVLSRTDDDFLKARGITKGAMLLIEEDRAASLYADMGPGVEMSGGSGANTIAGLASLGGAGSFIGKVRDDQLGDVFTHDIRSIGVEFRTAPATDGPSTARCLVLVTPDGERTLNTFLGACSGLGPDDVDETQVTAAKVTYLEGYLWDPPEAKEAFLKAARLARKADRDVAITLSDPFCVERHREEFLHLVRHEVNVVFANEAEIKSLYQVERFDDALQAAKRDCGLAVITRSAAGCVIADGNDVHVVEAVKVDRVVDSTGAGDLFAAGFLFGLTHGRELADCGRLGALAAAEVISHVGARPVTDLAQLAKSHGLM